MRVTIQAVGDLREYFGREPREIALPEGARARDLLEQIDHLWGAALPAYLWDAQNRKFRGPVFFVVNRKVVQDLDSPLRDGMEITILRALAGG